MLLLEMEMFVTEIKVNQVVSVSGYPLYCLHDAVVQCGVFSLFMSLTLHNSTTFTRKMAIVVYRSKSLL